MSRRFPHVTIHGLTRVRQGFLSIDAAEISFADEGARRRTVEVLERKDAAAVLVHDRDADALLLVRQFRVPVRLRDGREDAGWTSEIIAGGIDDGEQPADAARREAVEETGVAVTACEHVATVFASPGGSSERLFVYYATVGAGARIGKGGGIEGERIQTEWIARRELYRRCRDGEIDDAKTLIAVQWLMLRTPGEAI